MHQRVTIALHHPEFYADKVKDVRESLKSITQHVACNTTIMFTNNGLLLSSESHNRSLFVIDYIWEQKVKRT